MAYLMAEELRYDLINGSVADGTTSADADGVHRNQSGEERSVRSLHIDLQLTAAGPGEDARFELSKQGSKQAGAIDGNEVGFTMPISISMPSTGATPSDGDISSNHTFLFAKGQLTLEDGEALFVNITKSTGGSILYNVLIGTHALDA